MDLKMIGQLISELDLAPRENDCVENRQRLSQEAVTRAETEVEAADARRECVLAVR